MIESKFHQCETPKLLQSYRFYIQERGSEGGWQSNSPKEEKASPGEKIHPPATAVACFDPSKTCRGPLDWEAPPDRIAHNFATALGQNSEESLCRDRQEIAHRLLDYV